MARAEGGLRVAVVDDERLVADTLSLILRLYGYVTNTHYSGESVVQGAREFRPEIILSDIQMFGLDGIDAAIEIRKLQPACRIILFTASPRNQSTQARINAHGFEFMERPLHPLDILALLQERVGSGFVDLARHSHRPEIA